jgi:hypothetical protein
VSDWESPDPAELISLRSDADWKALLGRYPALNSRPLQRCLEVAKAGGATTAVIETRYLDEDYRSEYSAFFSKTFAEISDTAHRVHFFRRALAADELWRLPDDHGYLGFMVVRPSWLGRVGRTMLAPPPELASAVRTSVESTVSFFGQRLLVVAVPFAQQDTQFGRCAQVAAWICHYTAALRHDTHRRAMADFTLLADANVVEGRPVPSQGLTGLQLTNLLREFGLPPLFYRMGELPTPNPNQNPPPHAPGQNPGEWDTRIISIACRYLNSGFPVLIGTYDHAFVLVGYDREPRPGDTDWIRFIRHDDQRGPYLVVPDVLADVDPATGDAYGWWTMLVAPVPERLWLAPEPAERAGQNYLRVVSQEAVVRGLVAERLALHTLHDRGHVTFRTYAITSTAFKAAAVDRGLDQVSAREYRLARLPRLVWVVEAVDRRKRRLGQPSVVGEAVFDSTSTDYDPRELIVRVPGALLVVQTDGTMRFPLATMRRACRSAAASQP